MGNCGSAPKTKGDNDAVPAPEPVEETVNAADLQEVKSQEEEKIDGGEKSADENKGPSLGSLLDQTEKKKEAEEKDKTIEGASKETEEAPKTVEGTSKEKEEAPKTHEVIKGEAEEASKVATNASTKEATKSEEKTADK
uniref:Uncharacterized protein n=1 Tax=Fagus sylvatica TaxID=28930 RepID=A0A2N9EG94_FAGSY